MKRNPRTCISAGHGEDSRKPGSVDPGADVKGSDYDEDDFARNISRRIVADLDALYDAVDRGRVYFRDEGHYSAADDFAAQRRCDYLLEIHLNAGGGTGTEALYRDSKDKAHAAKMSEEVARSLRLRNRGAKYRADLAVLAPKEGMTQVLIELFFADSPGGRDLAAYRKYKVQMELAILNRILTHYGWPKVSSLPRKWGSIRRSAYARQLKR